MAPHRTNTERLRRLSALAATLAFLAAAGCAADTDDVGGATSATEPTPAVGASPFPVTIQNCGSPLTVTAPPSKAVANDVNSVELMLALGLADRMVGTFGVGADAADGMTPALRAEYDEVPHVSPDYLTLEPLVGLAPDFLFAGWNYGLEQGSATLTPQALKNQHGITTLALTESCAHVASDSPAVSVEATYTDLANLAAIFGVQDRAQAVIEAMKATIADVRATLGSVEPTRVFLYDAGTDAPFTAPGLAMPNALLELAGARNVFADLRKTWTTVSWEEVVAADPECVLINDYGTPSWQQKKEFFTTFALTRNTTAVRNDCFFHLRYDELTPSPRNADAVAAIARWLHPTAFDSPIGTPTSDPTPAAGAGS